MPTRLRQALGFLAAGFILAFGCAGCADPTTSSVRHYFALSPSTPLTEDTIKSALLSRFPVGTPVQQAETWLAAQGLSASGHQSDAVFYQFFYTANFLDLYQRRVQICFAIDEQQKIKDISVSEIIWSL